MENPLESWNPLWNSLEKTLENVGNPEDIGSHWMAPIKALAPGDGSLSPKSPGQGIPDSNFWKRGLEHESSGDAIMLIFFFEYFGFHIYKQ